MGPIYRRIAVIGAGPSGLAAVKSLAEEQAFDHIRCFERKSCVGGLWAYDAEPDEFSWSSYEAELATQTPSDLTEHAATLLEPLADRPWLQNASYDNLDTNAGARTMAYTHTPLPFANSAQSVRKFGRNNSTRPRHAVLRYLEDLWKPYLHLLSLNTHVESVEKRADGRHVLTLRKPGVGQDGGVSGENRGPVKDLWWQEVYDAVIVASGHFTVPKIPRIDGLEEVSTKFPSRFEHSKSWRSSEDYTNKKVIVVGGGVSAADLAEELHDIVQDRLILSQRNELEFLKNAWTLPGILKKPEIVRFYDDDNNDNGRVHAEFADGSVVDDFDKVIFATGYRLSYPFLPFQPVTAQNRLSGFYQHVFRIGDPSLTVIGQVRAAISFRIYEYQAVAVARYYAGRTKPLPDIGAQQEWERTRLAYKGPTELFHEIKPDFTEYYGWLRDLAGPPADATQGYVLPVFEEDWVKSDIEVLIAKNEYWGRLAEQQRQDAAAELDAVAATEAVVRQHTQ